MAERNTVQRPINFMIVAVAATAVIETGKIVVLNGGYAEEGSIASGLIAIGRAEETVDNSAGADGDVNIKVRPGCFKLENDATNPVLITDIGKECYIVDSQTVSISHDTNARSKAGAVIDVDNDGVWVQIQPW